MATLALAAVGAAAGSALLPGGITLLGATLTGATLGAQAGALAGSFIDQSLFAASGRARAVSGPRLSDLKVTASTEGAPVPRLYGRARLGGQIIWATDLEEERVSLSIAFTHARTCTRKARKTGLFFSLSSFGVRHRSLTIAF